MAESIEELEEFLVNPEKPLPEEPEETAEAETEEEPKEEEATAEEPEETKAEEPEPEPEEAPAAPQETIPLAALLDEREKRQKYERELEELRKQQAEPVELPDVLQDKEGFAQTMEERVLSQARQLVFADQREAQLEMHDDYQQAEDWANEQLSTGNAALTAQLQGAVNVPRATYKLWKQSQQLEQVGDIDKLIAKAKEEGRLEALKEQQAEQAKQEASEKEKDEALKPSLADVGESGVENVIGESMEEWDNESPQKVGQAWKG